MLIARCQNEEEIVLGCSSLVRKLKQSRSRTASDRWALTCSFVLFCFSLERMGISQCLFYLTIERTLYRPRKFRTLGCQFGDQAAQWHGSKKESFNYSNIQTHFVCMLTLECFYFFFCHCCITTYMN
jgi:hypothetical protein